jgi:hypothetical protein
MNSLVCLILVAILCIVTFTLIYFQVLNDVEAEAEEIPIPSTFTQAPPLRIPPVLIVPTPLTS